MPPKSGWKTTELWLAVLAVGALIYVCQSLVTELPAIAATPGLPPWAVAALGIAPVVLGWAAKALVSEYAKLRTQLKLPADVQTAQAAGADAAKLPAPADILNK